MITICLFILLLSCQRKRQWEVKSRDHSDACCSINQIVCVFCTSAGAVVLLSSVKLHKWVHIGRPSCLCVCGSRAHFAPSARTPAGRHSRDAHTGWKELQVNSWPMYSKHPHKCQSGIFEHTPVPHALHLGGETESLVKILQFVNELWGKASEHYLFLQCCYNPVNTHTHTCIRWDNIKINYRQDIRRVLWVYLCSKTTLASATLAVGDFRVTVLQRNTSNKEQTVDNFEDHH